MMMAKDDSIDIKSNYILLLQALDRGINTWVLGESGSPKIV